MLLKNVEKHELRSHFKRIRAKLEKSNKEELDLKLAERFLTSEQYIGCRVLFAYVSTPIEVDTSVIISSLYVYLLGLPFQNVTETEIWSFTT